MRGSSSEPLSRSVVRILSLILALAGTGSLATGDEPRWPADEDGYRQATLRRYAERRSILDSVLGEAGALHKRLGRDDKQKLNEYLGSVRETGRFRNGQFFISQNRKPQCSCLSIALHQQPIPNNKSNNKGNDHGARCWCC